MTQGDSSLPKKKQVHHPGGGKWGVSGNSCCDSGPRSLPYFCPTSGYQQPLPTGNTGPLGSRLSLRSVTLAHGGGAARDTRGNGQLSQERLQRGSRQKPSRTAPTQYLPGGGDERLRGITRGLWGHWLLSPVGPCNTLILALLRPPALGWEFCFLIPRTRAGGGGRSMVGGWGCWLRRGG